MLRITQEMRHFEAIFLRPDASPAPLRPGSSICSRNCPSPDTRSLGPRRSCTSAGDSGRTKLAVPASQQDSRNHDGGHGRRLLRVGWIRAARVPGFGGRWQSSRPCLQPRAARSRTGPADGSGEHRASLPDRAGSAGRIGAGRISHDITELLRGTGAQFAVLARRIRRRSAALEQRRNHRGCGHRQRRRHDRRLPPTPWTGRRRRNIHPEPGPIHRPPKRTACAARGHATRVETVNVGGDVSFVGHGTMAALP